ncbi:MAG: amidohydrolase family protein [Acidobacteriota bacterium]|nr:amidohydrolase family protein [Acidobacteriota bacterium]
MKITACALLALCLSPWAFAAGLEAFVGARIVDGTGAPPLENGTIVVRDGRIVAVDRGIAIPAGAQRIDVNGKTIIPGLINAHGHVSALPQLGVYARYGVTTVFSLGGDNEIALRDRTRAEQQTPNLNRARLFIAGPIPTSKTPADGRRAVDANAAAKTDIMKIRIDDQLGEAAPMPPDVYTAIVEQAHKDGLRMAVHVVKLADAKAVLKLGADYIAHSVRDRPIDDETIALLKKNGSFYCPTLMREVSTFIYPDNPPFLNDPFFLRDANPAESAKVREAAFKQSMRASKAAEWYKEHLPVAMRNLKKLDAAGVPVVMGTDTGPPYRFQGYFEHLELQRMVESGLTPMKAIVDATSVPAKLLKQSGEIGVLQPGRWADLVVLNANPLDDIRNTMKVDSVWIAGNRVPAK